MSTHVLKNTDTHFVIQIVNEDSHTINFADAIHNTVTPSGFKIMGVFWSQAGGAGNEHINIDRNSVTVLDLHGSGQFDFAGQYFNIDDESTSAIDVSHTNTGHHYMLILKLRKVI